MHNNIGYGSGVTNAKINEMNIEVLQRGEFTMYLGRALCLSDTHEVELHHRMRKAWAKFGILRQELIDKTIPLHLRLKLFHTVVSPTALYGSGSWVMTNSRDATLKTTQMKMLRAIVGNKRLISSGSSELETWVDWTKRTTEDVRHLMQIHKIPEWVGLQRIAMKKWLGKVEAMNSNRWAKIVLNWHPTGFRSRGRPVIRWVDQAALA